MLGLSTSPPGIDPKCQPKGDWVMLLTKKACYGLMAVRHLAEQSRETSFSAKDLADFHGFPQEALAKILQRLTRADFRITESRAGIHWHVTRTRFPCST